MSDVPVTHRTDGSLIVSMFFVDLNNLSGSSAPVSQFAANRGSWSFTTMLIDVGSTCDSIAPLLALLEPIGTWTITGEAKFIVSRFKVTAFEFLELLIK